MSEITVQNTPAPMRARDYDRSQLQLVKRTVAKDCNDDEFNMFIEICKRQGLDPFRKQIYAFVFNKDDAKKRQFVTVTGIDGYRAVAKRTGTYRPSDEEPDIEYDEARKGDENPLGIVRAKVKVYQFGPDRQWYPVVGVATWDEFAPIEAAEYEYVDSGETWPDGNPKKRRKPKGDKKKLSKENWQKMPEIMISKCAEAQALRKGWPEEVGGMYVFEEMDKMQSDMTATDVISEYEEKQRLQIVGGHDSIPLIFENMTGIEMVQTGQVFDKVVAHLLKLETSSEVEVWQDQNRVGLQQFWARQKSDALELKKNIEAEIKKKPQFKPKDGEFNEQP